MTTPRRGSKIVIERTYRARLEDVWDLWTTKQGFESWWGPQGFRADVHAIDARVGGELRYDMVADTPEMVAAMKQMGRPASHATHARFTELKPHERLVITNVIDFLPEVATYESVIAVDLARKAIACAWWSRSIRRTATSSRRCRSKASRASSPSSTPASAPERLRRLCARLGGPW